MTEKEITDGNQLIADFIGYKRTTQYVDVGEFNPELKPEDCWVTPDGKHPRYLCFHTSWDWLIPVCNRILKVYSESETVRLKLNNDKNFVIKHGTKNMLSTFENQYHINSTWLKVTDFIRWYYQNN